MVTQGTRTPADEEDEGSDIDGGSAAMNNEENEYTRGVSDDEDEIAAREDDNDDDDEGEEEGEGEGEGEGVACGGRVGVASGFLGVEWS